MTVNTWIVVAGDPAIGTLISTARSPLGGDAAALVIALVIAPAASALDQVNTNPLRKAVTVNGVLRHERALQAIANANLGTRVSGTAGFDQSADYVKRQLVQAGYKVTEQPFEFPFFQETAPSVFERVSPEPRTFTDKEFATMSYSGSGDVTAKLQAVDVVVPIGDNPPNTSTSGCEPADFAGFAAGNVALMQRGTCSFAVKAQNAEAAGAIGAVIFNEGQAPADPGDEDRRVTLQGTLGAPGITIPVVGTDYAIGEELTNQTRAGRRHRPPLHRDDLRDPDDQERHRRLQGRRRPLADHRRRLAPGLRARRPGHQRQRLRHGDRSRDGDPGRQARAQAAPRVALCLLGRRGGRPARIDALRRDPRSQGERHLREPQLRHAGLAELRALRLRRRRLGYGHGRASGLGQIEALFNQYYAGQRPGDEPDRVRRAL